MKKIINILFLSVLSLSSCDKFLDVQPRSQVELNEMFSDEKGFQDALSGVYVQMRNNDTYGARLSQTSVESLVSAWDVTSGSEEQKLGQFMYGDAQVDKSLSAIFSKQYSTIANVNAILNNIDSKRQVFRTTGLYEMIKGEALAIRAYIHLDLLRLFGPIPSDPTKGSQLAYVTELSSSINRHLSFDEYKGLLLKDIEESAVLLKTIDPILDWSLEQLRNPASTSSSEDVFRTENIFFAFRGFRLNYFAVRALEARAQLWFGNKEKAYTAAKEVVEAKKKDNSVKFRLGGIADFNAGDNVLRVEQIFGLYDPTMFEWYNSRYANGVYKKGTAVTPVSSVLFGNSDTDIRLSRLWSLVTLNDGVKAHIIKKYETKDPNIVALSSDFKQIPMIRTSEMYLILAEVAPFSEGLQYFKTFRSNRGLTAMVDPISSDALQTEIIKEYRKEFFAEGQSFFVYKRNNTPKNAFVFAPTSSAVVVNYLLPLPSVEAFSE